MQKWLKADRLHICPMLNIHHKIHVSFQDEENLLNFHFSNLEYACGCPLSCLSSLNWDQNEAYEQFAGAHTLMTDGYSPLLRKLADGLDIRLHTKVTKVDHTSDVVTVTTSDQQEFTASKVSIL